jgi:ferritin-like metal-binding protein YciE
MPEQQSAKDLKLIQYLNEAYGKEKELETALEAHIAMTTRAPYKKRLRQHLGETKGHARRVERRIKQLGGRAEVVPAPGPEALADAASAVQSVASKAVSAAKGPLHALRGTGDEEKLLKNAKTEYWNEAEEIATYSALETLAESVGDRETAKLARAIKREEERMQSFLERLIPQLTKAVARAEIPASERNGGRRRRSTGKRSGTRSSSAKRTSSARSGSGSRRRSKTSSGSRSKSSSGRSRSKSGSGSRSRS